MLYTSHLNCLLYHTTFSQFSELLYLPLIPWTLTSHISLHGRYRTLIDFQCKHWNGPAAFTEKNIDLLFFCLKMWAEERKKKKDKLRDGYWFHPVQIEGSTVPSTSDFKGLYFDPNVTRREEEARKCVTNLVALCDVIPCGWTSGCRRLSCPRIILFRLLNPSRWRRHDLPKRPEYLTQRHTVTVLKTWILNHAAAGGWNI